MTGLVSIIVPVYNAAEHLERCIGSLITQSYADLEIITVNDGSTDDSAEIVASFARRDPRVLSFDQQNSGVSSARNAGLDAATGTHVCFVDADDWMEPEAIELMMGTLQSRGLDFVTCSHHVDSPSASRMVPTPERFQRDLDTFGGVESALATRFVFGKIFARELIGATRFRADLHWGEDTVFVIEVALRAARSRVLPDPFYHYVQSEGSATRSAINPKRLTGIRMTEVLEELVAESHPSLIDRILQTRVNIIAIMAEDALAASPAERANHLTMLKNRMRIDVGRTVRSRGVPMFTKVKAIVLAINPRIFTSARHVRNLIRSRS